MRAPDHAKVPATLEAYLTQLDGSLAQLSPDERREIILETRSHIVERMQRDPSLEIQDVLGELGSPESYAFGFLPKPEIETKGSALTNIASLATSGWKQTPTLLLVACGYGIAAIFVFVAIAKIMEPNATGWYSRTIGDHHSTGLVLSDPNHGGRDILGWWLVPITLSIALSIHWLLSRLLRRVARKSLSL